MNGIKEMVDLQDIQEPKVAIQHMFRKHLKGMPFMAADGSIRMRGGWRITAKTVSQAYAWSKITDGEEIDLVELSIGSGILVRFTGDIAVEMHRVRFSLFLAGWTPNFPFSLEDQS